VSGSEPGRHRHTKIYSSSSLGVRERTDANGGCGQSTPSTPSFGTVAWIEDPLWLALSWFCMFDDPTLSERVIESVGELVSPAAKRPAQQPHRDAGFGHHLVPDALGTFDGPPALDGGIARDLPLGQAVGGLVTFKKYAEQWRESQVHRTGTTSQVETNLRLHVYPRIGSRPIGAIRQSEIQSLVKALVTEDGDRPPLAASTAGTVYVWVATIFGAAVADRVLAQTPCREIKLPEVELTKVVPLEPGTVSALIGAVPKRYSALCLLGAGTGVRISEALGTTLDRIDFLRRVLTIDRQLVKIADGLPVFGPVKDRRNRPRAIPLPDVVLDGLADHLSAWPVGPTGLVFTNERNRPISRTTFSDIWRTAAGPLGIPSGDGFHQLRHFYASLLIRHGESVKVVQERLGHQSAVMTLDVYGHLWPDSDDSTRAAVDAVLNNSPVSGACHEVVTQN
jgi:integrase